MRMINTPSCWTVYAPLTIFFVDDGTPYKVLGLTDYVRETPTMPEDFVRLVEDNQERLIPYGNIRYMTDRNGNFFGSIMIEHKEPSGSFFFVHASGAAAVPSVP